MNIKSSRKEYKWTCRRHQKVGATGRVTDPIRDMWICYVHVLDALFHCILYNVFYNFILYACTWAAVDAVVVVVTNIYSKRRRHVRKFTFRLHIFIHIFMHIFLSTSRLLSLFVSPFLLLLGLFVSRSNSHQNKLSIEMIIAFRSQHTFVPSKSHSNAKQKKKKLSSKFM